MLASSSLGGWLGAATWALPAGTMTPNDDDHPPAEAPLAAADRAVDHVAGRARADGGHHQPGLPPGMPRVRHRWSPGGGLDRPRGCLRQRDGHRPRPRRAQRGDHAAGRARPRRVPALGAALLGRPGHRPGCCPNPGAGEPRRPPRPQLRLPGPQGDPKGWRSRAAVEARAVRGDRRCRRGRGRPRAGTGDGEAAHGHRRRAPHLPRRWVSSPRTKERRRSRSTRGRRRRPTPGGPTGRRSARSSST